MIGGPRVQRSPLVRLAITAAVLATVIGLATCAHAGDRRPGAWCGWWMRHHLGVADRRYNLARQWARYGVRAAGPGVGVIVVWAHHVGIITGGSPGRWIVKSGNDGGRVRERVRSLAGAIAFRRASWTMTASSSSAAR